MSKDKGENSSNLHIISIANKHSTQRFPMKNSRAASAAAKRKSSSTNTNASASASVGAATALDASLITIKIVATRPEEAAQPSLSLDKAMPSTAQTQPGSPASQSQPQQHRHQQQSSPSLRFLVALAPNTIFACVSGVLGLAGACAVVLLALVVLLAACVVHFFQGMALMLAQTDRAMLQFTTGAAASPRPTRRSSAGSTTQPKKKTSADNAGSELIQSVLSLLSLSCELLSIGFFKGTIGLSYCCSLYGAIAIPTLIWTAGGSTATALSSHSFNHAPAAFVLLHGGLWLFALAWLVVTGSMSTYCSQNLSPRR